MDTKMKLGILFFMAATFSTIAANSKVVVVGGGIAGLTAAYRLQESGLDVELYEARGRVGGRIFTAQINGRPGELGGQNISDGGEAVHLRQLIDEFGLELVSRPITLNHSYFTGTDLVSVGQLLKEKRLEAKELRNTIADLALRSANMKEMVEKIVEPGSDLYKTIAVRMAAYEGGSLEKLSPLYGETLFHVLQGGICAAHQGNGEEDTSVDFVTIKEGNSLLPLALQKKLGAKVHLEMPLKKVGKVEEGGYALTFENGEVVRADILVLAIPCTVYDSIAFEEGIIPAQKLEAIHRVQYGENAKILISCPNSTVQKPEVLLKDEVISFLDTKGQILGCYYTGKASYFSSETLLDAYGKAKPLVEREAFKECLLDSFQYAKDQAGQSYVGPVGYSWPNDPFAKGTYSYIAAGQEEILTATEEQGDVSFKALFAPIGGSLYFAGEHASILAEVPGTMEAACESGERVARAIIQKAIASSP